SEGNDSLFGGTGDDLLFGEDGDDLILGDEGADLLSGDLGNDLMSGGQGEDELLGSAGQDVLIGGGQIDRLTGGAGEDLLVGTEITHNHSALSNLHAIWGSTASFARRINDIQDSETLALQMNVSVVDDHVVDQVFGGTESDWILLPGIHATYDPFGSSIPHDSPNHDHSSHSHTHDGGHSHGGTIIDHPPVVEGFALIDSLDNLGDLNDEDVLHTVIPHASEPSKRLEHLALFELVRYDQVTHTVAESGDWSDPSTWKDEQMPGDGARILVPVGIELNVDRAISAEVTTIRVDGTLSFSADGNSELRADTIVVSEMGRFQMGTAAEPVQEHVT
ncbi:MAG: G8 domain-containing protein, partial [Lacipirellulaceae bacterium]